MTWSKFDDLFDEHPKVDEAWHEDPATIGLHVQATTHCSRLLTDGVVQPLWLKAKLPSAKRRAKVLEILERTGLFDVIRTGETLRVVDLEGNTIALGPFSEKRYVVHGFLLRHESSVMVKDRRRRDAERKARARAKNYGMSARTNTGQAPDVRDVFARTDTGQDSESAECPPGSRRRARAGARALPIQSNPIKDFPPTPEGQNPEDNSEDGDLTPRTTREQARSVPCPACGAPPGSACTGRNGDRIQHHLARHTAAIAAGAKPLDPKPSPGDGRSPRPDPPPVAELDPNGPLPKPPDSARKRWQREWEEQCAAWMTANGFEGLPRALTHCARRLELWRAATGPEAAAWARSTIAERPATFNAVRINPGENGGG